MSDLLIKQMPPALHAKLREQSRRHRRSMTQEALTILEKGLGVAAAEFPPPISGKRLLTQRLVTKGIREGRA